MIIKNPIFIISKANAISISKPGADENVTIQITGEFDINSYLIDDVKAEIQDYRATVELLLETLHAKKLAAQAAIDAAKEPKP